MFIRRLFLSAVFLLGAYTVFSQAPWLSVSELQWLKEHPVIRVGVGTSFPPIQYVAEENGYYEFQGIAGDYLRIISDLLGIELRVEYGITFPEALEKGRNKEIDLFPCIAFSEERASFLLFSEGYLENPNVIFSNDDAPFIGSIQDLSGLRVADVEALYLYNYLKKDVPGINFVLSPDAETSLENVAFGRADANVTGLISGSYLIRKNNWTNIKVAAPTPYPNTVFRMAVRDDWPEFAAIIDKALHAIDQDARNEINRKWIAVRYEYGIDTKSVIKRLLIVGGISAVVILIILSWAIRLRLEIKKRKETENSLYARELELREMVKEKELLIREVNHRVKNNLALAASFVNIQAYELTSKEDFEKMEMVIHRIHSMILLHEKLSMSPDVTKIDVSDYLSELVNGLEQTRTGSTSGIELRLNAVSVSFDTKLIIPIGLIITELVTNALKYGYPEGGPGLIEIILDKRRDGGFLLTVKNDGAPISGDIELTNLKTLGLKLVVSLVEQLNGQLDLIKSPCPAFNISFDYHD